MPRKRLPRIVAVRADKKPFGLLVRWNHVVEETPVDVSALIATFKFYEPLRNAPEIFRQVQVGEDGGDIVWPGDIDMAADSVWRLAQEQAGYTMTPDAFRHWREHRSFTLDAAAQALGLSRRMVAYYDQGEKPIPRVVALATRGLDAA